MQPQWQDGRDLVTSSQPWVEILSWKPRAFLYHNFLTSEEADHIVKEAKPFVCFSRHNLVNWFRASSHISHVMFMMQMKRSTVIGSDGSSVEDPVRTSYGTFLSRLHTPTISVIQQRVAEWTKINITHQEDLQVLRYGLGQKYGTHFDSLDNGSPRVATVLLYLSDVDEGGETAFPMNSEWIDDSVKQRLGPFSSCAEGHVAARAKKGDALLFYSLRTDGGQDSAAMHTGCPVLKGTKWTGTIWVHTLPFRLETFGQMIHDNGIVPDDCVDAYPDDCKKWAEIGECTNNAKYMTGDAFNLGFCRFSCKACEVCADGDLVCRSRNRVNAGYLSLEELNAE